MTALEELKKAFPNMFRPLEWHHFDGPTEHGCGEWYAHATRGMYHIYDVREKFPNDRPFYAKELSDQFDTLEQAQDAVQNRHELDIVMCLDPDFRSTIESLQRENDMLKAGIKRLSDEEELLAETTDGDMMSLVSLAAKLAEAEQLARTYEGEANQLRDVSISNRIRAEEAEAGEKKLREVLAFYANPEIYKPHPHGPAFDRRDLSYSARTALASTGGEHHAE
ncbi:MULTISPECIES: hypothetical protein [Agrobacterium]|uniref:hypothetical protein n=1 Tax=Agrobacterium tumefaciens TaxID=358 RepID=UPI001571EDD4|nr:hypothetical protein [Agrobacterium tumefaciens]